MCVGRPIAHASSAERPSAGFRRIDHGAAERSLPQRLCYLEFSHDFVEFGLFAVPKDMPAVNEPGHSVVVGIVVDSDPCSSHSPAPP